MLSGARQASIQYPMNRILLLLTLFAYSFAQGQVNRTPVQNMGWEESEEFVNGFARVMKGNQFGFINTGNDVICPPQFDDARNFRHGLAAVKKNNQWGFINEKGRLVIPFQYDIVFDFSEQNTAALIKNQWLLINQNGIVVKRLDITVCFGFHDAIAKVEKEGRAGLMDNNGNIEWGSEKSNNNRTIANSTNQASGNCPENIDFENGSFLNWRCFTGRVDSVGNTNVITVNPSPVTANRHTLITRTMPSAIDPYGLFPINPPDGSNYAIRLGNTNIGAQAERIQYTLRVPINDSNFSIRYNYAVVFQDPGHSNWTQPRFQARLLDSASNQYITCATFDYISTSSLPGFTVSPVDTSVIYKSWSSAFISLRGYAGKTLYLEFTTADCVKRGHWGYAYVDVESTCGQSVNMQYQCGNPSTATISAPPGFQSYNWWNTDFSVLLGTGQQVSLNPAPPVNSTIWMELIPYNDFGCRDSFPVRLTGNFNPQINVSEQNAICAPHTFQFTHQHVPSLSAHWDFGDGQIATGDSVSHTYILPGNYTVTLTVVLPSGCEGTTTQVINIAQPSGSFNYSGGNFCGSRRVRFDATTNLVDSIRWDFGDGTVVTTAQPTIYHTYSTPGTYLPVATFISNAGCVIRVTGTDSIKIESLSAGFTYSASQHCDYTEISFFNASTSHFGINSYAWDFGDGQMASGQQVSHQYTQSGNYSVSLIITGIFGCRDTLIQPVPVILFQNPSVSITGDSIVCAMSSITFQAQVQSADPIDSLHWVSSNGLTGTGNSFSAMFDQSGSYDVQLIATTVHGCSDTATHTITVNQLPSIIQPSDIVVCHDVQINDIEFSGNMSAAVYNWTNSNTGIGLASSGNGNIAAFTAINTGSIPETANIIVTATSGNCTSQPVRFIITVKPLPSVAQPDDQFVCDRGVTQAVIFSNLSGAYIYQWANNNTSIGLASNGTGNIPSFTAMNNGTAPVTSVISITATDDGCSGLPETFTITVNPTPSMDQPADQPVCHGNMQQQIDFTGMVSGTTFEWVNSLPSIGLAASGSGNIPAFIAQNANTTAVTAQINVTPVANGCNGTQVSFSIVVNPAPSVNQIGNQSLCTGNPTTPVLFSGNIGNTNYNWTNNLPSIGLMPQGTGDIPSFTPINHNSNPITATIVVIPSTGNCAGNSASFDITVYPIANLVQPLNQFLCNGENTFPVSFFGTTGGTTFTWTNDNPSIGLAAGGTGSIPAFTAVNASNTTVTANITVTAMANNCPGVSRVFTFFIDPTPDMAQPQNLVVCHGAVVDPVEFTGTVTGTTFTWINSTSAIGLAASGTGGTSSFIAQNHTPFPITAIISVTGFANSCASVTKVFTITVYPLADMVVPDNQQVCNGEAASSIQFSGTMNGLTFNWTNDQAGIGLAASGNGHIPAFTAINNDSVDVISNIFVSAVNNGCSGPVASFSITIHPSPRMNATVDSRICRGNSLQLSASNAQVFSWSPAQNLSCTGCASPITTTLTTTQYYVQGTSVFGCVGRDTVNIEVIQPFNMPVSAPDTLCLGESTRLMASGAASYIWSPAEGLNRADIADPVASPSSSTRYRVIGRDAYGCFTDTGYVNVTVGLIPTVNAGPDLTSAAGSTITLNPVTQNGPITQWSWSPPTGLNCTDCPSPVVDVRTGISYIVTVRNSFGCFGSDTIAINSLCKSSQVFVPNAFTPDGDGLNDILMVRGSGIRVKSFRIFNRWGNLVFEKLNFEPNSPAYGWDGKVRGVPAAPDVFVYTAEVICDNGVINTLKGNTTIIR